MIEHKIGSYILNDSPIVINEGRRTCELDVTNTGDRVIQVGSHYHFFEVNRTLRFDREKAFGMHLDIPSGKAIRFPAGQTITVQLTEYGGKQRIVGFNGLTNGMIQEPGIREKAIEKACSRKFMEETSP